MRWYSNRLERFLTADEHESSDKTDFMPLTSYPEYPAVVLVHTVSEATHDEGLFVNGDLIIEGSAGDATQRALIEALSVKLSDALGTRLDERRVSLKEWTEASKKAPWALIDFSATTDWPQRRKWSPAK